MANWHTPRVLRAGRKFGVMLHHVLHLVEAAAQVVAAHHQVLEHDLAQAQVQRDFGAGVVAQGAGRRSVEGQQAGLLCAVSAS